MLDFVRQQPFGVELSNRQLSNLSKGDIDALRQTLATEGVVVARNQRLSDDALATFLASLGRVIFTDGEKPVSGVPCLNVVTNANRTRPPRSVFHTDTSYVSRPPAFTALRAVELPPQGGETLFVNQYEALERLPTSLRRRLPGVRVLHRATGLPPDVTTHGQWHPLVRLNPDSGREALFLSTPARCVALSSSKHALPRQLISFLYHHSITGGSLYRHRWCEGDVVLWDNRCTLHRADHSNVSGQRTLHRGLVEGEKPRIAMRTPSRVSGAKAKLIRRAR
ncbi:MAG: TauD/TfdA family dioxygenase [Planctomycetota bacterium]